MRRRLLALSISCFWLSGCDVLRLLLPHKATITAEALGAMRHGGVLPESISWRVTEDGAFASGKKSSDASPIAHRQSNWLLRWAQANRVEVRFIGWEARPSLRTSAERPGLSIAVEDLWQAFEADEW